MKKSVMLFLLMCSVGLLACQLQYLISGKPTADTEVPAKAKTTATVNAGSSAPSSVQAQTLVTANGDVVIRSTASPVAPSLGQLQQGDSVPVTARTAANDWFQVSVFSGLMMTQGWVPANQVTLEGSLDKIPVIQPGAPPPPPTSSQAAPPTPPRQTYPSSSQRAAPTPTRKTYP